MKLTKQQRHMAYMIMLAEVETNLHYWVDYGFCNMINLLFDCHNSGEVGGSGFYNNVIKNFFPELQAKEYSEFELLQNGWPEWNDSGWEQRRNLLIECITETA